MPEVADNGLEVDALAALPAAQQAAAVAAVKGGDAPNLRAAIATTAPPTGRAGADADRPLDAILEQIRRLDKDDRERLWDTLADQWRGEVSRALDLPVFQSGRPSAHDIAEPVAPSRPILEEGGNNAAGLLRQEAPSARLTQSHPDIGGGRL